MIKTKVLGIGIILLLIVTTIPMVSSEAHPEETKSQYDYIYRVSVIGRITDVYEHEGGIHFTIVRGFGRIVQTTNTGFLYSVFRCKNAPTFFSCNGEFKGILGKNFICGTYTLEQHVPLLQSIFPVDEMQIV